MQPHYLCAIVRLIYLYDSVVYFFISSSTTTTPIVDGLRTLAVAEPKSHRT